MADEQLFGKYRLVRRLAFGGMAEIFLAQLIGDEGFQKSVVLKRILPQFSADPDFTRMFVDEAVLAAKLTHPNVAQVYDFGQVAGTYFITMEHVDGTDLRKLIRAATDRNRVLTPVEVAAIGEGMAKGLSYVHSAENDDGRPLSIVHRDISPHNVMLSRGGDIKIMDFGIAKAAARATQTATGTIKGKLAYMAPEQALGDEVDKLSDQFAVGLVLWECLVGKRVFEGDSEPELMSRVAAGRVRKLKDFAPDVPEALDRIIMRALNVERGRRYPDLRDLEHDLASFRYGLASAGAVRLSALVDELVPREPNRGAREARTVVLAAGGTAALPPPPQMMSTPGPVDDRDPWADTAGLAATPSVKRDASDPSFPVQNSWTDGGGLTDPTRLSGPARQPSPPTEVAAERARAPRETKTARRPTWLIAGVVMLLGAIAAGAVLVRFSRPRPATLMIESEPSGAALWMGETPEEPLRPTGLVTPASIRGRTVGDSVHWRLEKEGMLPLEQTTTLTQDVQHAKVSLEKALGLAPEPIAVADAVPQSKHGATLEPPPEPATKLVETKLKSTKADKPKKSPTGYLSLRTRGPWVEVYLNKKKLGTTPLNRVEVPAGVITLQLRGQNGQNRTANVDIPEGETLAQTIDTN